MANHMFTHQKNYWSKNPERSEPRGNQNNLEGPAAQGGKVEERKFFLQGFVFILKCRLGKYLNNDLSTWPLRAFKKGI